ncbi:MAG TPA: RNA 2',3'-cyclic phosphodiesterase [Nitrososphaerales archaeon]|nr:RNA 2',3'-cyclic phosphodiesterase [Nitrososphaerales archaeon]
MRAFVALEISNPTLDSLVEFEKRLMATGADIKLVEKQNLHFTVKFLGEINESQAAEVGSRLGSLRLNAVDVEVRGAGAFPDPSRARVVWAGVSRDHEALVAPIAQQVIDSLEGIGEREERPFRAHITLGRVRSGRNLRQLEQLLRDNSDRPFGVVRLSHLKLKSSVLSPGGPIYGDLGDYPLV